MTFSVPGWTSCTFDSGRSRLISKQQLILEFYGNGVLRLLLNEMLFSLNPMQVWKSKSSRHDKTHKNVVATLKRFCGVGKMFVVFSYNLHDLCITDWFSLVDVAILVTINLLLINTAPCFRTICQDYSYSLDLMFDWSLSSMKQS